ncbi:MAG: cupredoxin domain-containing protein [Acidimicrobiales bacterium]
MPTLTALLAIGVLAFVACAGDQGGDTTARDLAAAVAIEGFLFTPTQLQVQNGTTVTWTNQDRFAHTVTSDAESFDSGDLAEGQSFEQSFDEPGTYPYHCAIHNYMTGTITVS